MLGPPDAIPPGCPWHALTRFGPPNVKWCEERLCAAINEPANAWSNLAFLAAALLVALAARRGPPLASPALRGFAPVLALVGACSFAYHATNVFLTQLLDFFGMYLFCLLLLGMSAARLGWLAPRRILLACVAGSAALTALTAALARAGAPIQAIVGALSLAIIALEPFALRRSAEPRRLRAFALAVALLVAAAICSALDVSRAWCDPQDHLLQGHAAWHVLAAASLLAAFAHYRQFDRELAPH